MAGLSDLKKETAINVRAGLGMGAFILHRVTGLALIFYLLLHIMVISTFMRGPDAFNNLLAVLTSPPFLAADLALLAAILFHSFNGIRILLFDLGIGIHQQKLIFWLLMTPAIILWLFTLYLTLPFIVKG